MLIHKQKGMLDASESLTSEPRVRKERRLPSTEILISPFWTWDLGAGGDYFELKLVNIKSACLRKKKKEIISCWAQSNDRQRLNEYWLQLISGVEKPILFSNIPITVRQKGQKPQNSFTKRPRKKKNWFEQKQKYIFEGNSVSDLCMSWFLLGLDTFLVE